VSVSIDTAAKLPIAKGLLRTLCKRLENSCSDEKLAS